MELIKPQLLKDEIIDMYNVFVTVHKYYNTFLLEMAILKLICNIEIFAFTIKIIQLYNKN